MKHHGKALKFRLPAWCTPRNTWRKAIHREALAAARRLGVAFCEDAKLSIKVKLYLPESALDIHDIDNRLKDILDALQGRVGGSKAERNLEPIITNDRNVFSATITKSLPPKQSHGLGHVIVSYMGFL